VIEGRHIGLPLRVYFIIALIFIVSPIVSIIAYFLKNIANPKYQASFLQYDPIIAGNKLGAITNSLILGLLCAVLASCLAFVLSICLQRFKRLSFLEVFAFLPMGISTVTFGLGFMLFKSYLNINSFLLLVIAHLVISFPLVFKVIYDGLKQIKREFALVAISLGASDWQVLSKVILPIMKNSLFTGFIFSFAISLGELGAAAVLQRGFITIPIAIYRYISARQFISATEMSIVLIVTALVSFYTLERLRGKR
jgi:thiamine transport system permease protein